MSPTRLSHLKIVVVEDHDDARRYLGYFLECLGAKVVLARNAFEGLDAIKNNHPSMVLSDIAMPGMDGFELLREIRALGPGGAASVPVIAMSAFLTHADLCANTRCRLQGLLAEAVHSRHVTGDHCGCA